MNADIESPQTNASPPPPSAPPRKKRRFIGVGVIGIVLLVGLIAYVRNPGLLDDLLASVSRFSSGDVAYERDGDANLGSLRAGPFNYINACDVFTASDLDDISGAKSNREEVDATFAFRTYAKEDPQRTYVSTCGRWDQVDVLGTNKIDVRIEQFSDPDLQAKIQGLESVKKFRTTDAELQAAFGEHAMLLEYPFGGGPSLIFTVDNKRITISPHLPDESAARDVVTAVGESVLRRLEDVESRPSQVLAYEGKDIKLGNTTTYRNACSLWKPDDFRKVMKEEPDEAEVQVVFAEAYQSKKIHREVGGTLSKCVIKTLPPKTKLDSGDLDMNRPTTSVELETTQFNTKQDARETFEFKAKGEEAVEGMDRPAALARGESPLGPTQTLFVLSDEVVISVHITAFESPGSLQATDQDQQLEVLQRIADTVVERL
jgi:hypothetical protein